LKFNHTAIPGKIVGRSKEPLNELKNLLEKFHEKARLTIFTKSQIILNVLKVQNPMSASQLLLTLLNN
jgi:ribosomal protein S3